MTLEMAASDWRARNCWPSDTTPIRLRLALIRLAASGYSLELLGCPISNPSLASCADPEPGPLPSTGITRLHRYYQPLRHPIVSGLSLAGVRLGFTLTHPMGFPVLRGLPLPCMPSPLPRRNLWVLTSLASPAVTAFP